MASRYLKQFKTPENFNNIMADFTREILRNRPKDIIDFAIEYFKWKEEIRDQENELTKNGTKHLPFDYYNKENNAKYIPKKPVDPKLIEAENKLKLSNEDLERLRKSYKDIEDMKKYDKELREKEFGVREGFGDIVDNPKQPVFEDDGYVRPDPFNDLAREEKERQERRRRRLAGEPEPEEDKKQESPKRKNGAFCEEENVEEMDFDKFVKYSRKNVIAKTLKGVVNPLGDQYIQSNIRHTKIICTLGPACDDENILEQMIYAGMDAALFNFSHGNYEEHLIRINRLKKVCKKLGKFIPMILDTKGPEIRLGIIKGKVQLKKGMEYTLTVEKGIEGDDKKASVSHKKFAKDLKIGDKVLIDDGLVEMVVKEKTEKEVKCEVLNDGEISSNKGVNLPGVKTTLPSLTEKDMNDIEFGVKNGFDYVAASFITCREDVIIIRNTLDICGGENVKIISKIENQSGLDNIDDIIDESDGIMVARGDLGVEIPVEKVAFSQKSLIDNALKHRKIVITATQMLDSMINNPRPTRAETSDITNAVVQGTGCCMLSGETAAGKYPLKAVETMNSVISESEKSLDIMDFEEIFEKYQENNKPDDVNYQKMGFYLSEAMTAVLLKARAIVNVCRSGGAAAYLSSCRPPQPIYAITHDEALARKVNLLWGVTPVLIDYVKDEPYKAKLQRGIDKLMDEGELIRGDLIVLGGGSYHIRNQDGIRIGGIMTV